MSKKKNKFTKNYKEIHLSVPKEELLGLIDFLNDTQPYGSVDRISQMFEDHSVIQLFENRNLDIADDEAFMAGVCFYLITRFNIPLAFLGKRDALSDVECTIVKPPHPEKVVHDKIEEFNAAFTSAKASNYLVLRFDNKRALKVGFVVCKGDGCVYNTADFKVLTYLWNGLDKDGVPKNGIGPWSLPDFKWKEKPNAADVVDRGL